MYGPDFRRAYSALMALSSQPECDTCRLCEENVGLVYVFKKEAARSESLRRSTCKTSESVAYVQRTRDGWCTHFSVEAGRCGVYEARPLCCRLYPLDLMQLDGEIWWVLHSECPIAKRFVVSRTLELLISVTVQLERTLVESDIGEWLSQDRVSQQIEAFHGDVASVVKLRRLRASTSGWFRFD